MEEKRELSLNDKINILFQEKIEADPIKTKKLKLPRKARVKKGKIKKNYLGILKIDENGNISGEKVQIEDSSYRLKEGSYHATNGEEILLWEGKFPVVVQSVKKVNPINFYTGGNEIYGQKYIMARMLKDAIKMKNKAGNIILWVVLIAGGLFAANYFLGGKV